MVAVRSFRTFMSIDTFITKRTDLPYVRRNRQYGDPTENRDADLYV